MHTDYEVQVENEEDEVAPQSRPALPPTTPEPLDTHHLKMARKYMGEYEHSINGDRNRFSDIVDRQVYEDRSYKQAMMHAAIAQAEATTLQAEVAESMLEFVADLVGGTDLVNALLHWSYRQKAE